MQSPTSRGSSAFQPASFSDTCPNSFVHGDGEGALLCPAREPSFSSRGLVSGRLAAGSWARLSHVASRLAAPSACPATVGASIRHCAACTPAAKRRPTPAPAPWRSRNARVACHTAPSDAAQCSEIGGGWRISRTADRTGAEIQSPGAEVAGGEPRTLLTWHGVGTGRRLVFSLAYRAGWVEPVPT